MKTLTQGLIKGFIKNIVIYHIGNANHWVIHKLYREKNANLIA